MKYVVSWAPLLYAGRDAAQMNVAILNIQLTPPLSVCSLLIESDVFGVVFFEILRVFELESIFFGAHNPAWSSG